MPEFTIDEMNLISIYPSNSRAILIETITDSLDFMDDDDMVQLAVRVIDRLTRMSNDEYESLELFPVYEYIDDIDEYVLRK